MLKARTEFLIPPAIRFPSSSNVKLLGGLPIHAHRTRSLPPFTNPLRAGEPIATKVVLSFF